MVQDDLYCCAGRPVSPRPSSTSTGARCTARSPSRPARAGRHVLRYEQHPRPLDDYRGDDDTSGFDGVTVQWFADMDAYRAHMAEPDFGDIWADIERFLDPGQLHFVLTEHPHLVMGEAAAFPLA